MRIAHYVVPFSTLIFTCAIQSAVAADYMLTPTQEDQQWLLPKVVPSPADNPTTPEKVALGKSLFFDPRLSSAGNVSCASCHIPQFGWTDGMIFPRNLVHHKPLLKPPVEVVFVAAASAACTRQEISNLS